MFFHQQLLKPLIGIVNYTFEHTLLVQIVSCLPGRFNPKCSGKLGGAPAGLSSRTCFNSVPSENVSIG